MSFSEKIVLLRKQAGLSQEELAEKLQISRQSISKWESGQSMPESDKLLSLSRALGSSVDFLLDDEKTSPADPLPTNSAKTSKRPTHDEQILSLALCIVGFLFLLSSAQMPWDSTPWVLLGVVLQIAGIAAFEIALRSDPQIGNHKEKRYHFYGIAVWPLLLYPTFYLLHSCFSLLSSTDLYRYFPSFLAKILTLLGQGSFVLAPLFSLLFCALISFVLLRKSKKMTSTQE